MIRLTAVASGFPMLRLVSGCASKLEDDKVSRSTEAAAGSSYALPTTIIMGASTGTGGAKYDVGTSEYKRKIDERIDRIRSTCKVQ